MELLIGSTPLISFSGKLNTDCCLDDVFREIKREHPTVIIQFTDKIEMNGPETQVLKAITLLWSQEVDVFLRNEYPTVEYRESDEFDKKKIRHAVRSGKDIVFGRIAARAGFPECIGKHAIRMVTPTTTRKQMIDNVADLKRCTVCKIEPFCFNASITGKGEELKWIRQ